MEQQEQPQQSQEMMALNILVKAAERYLATLDDVARPPTQQHLQGAISVLVTALNPTVPVPEEVEAKKDSKKNK